MNLFTNVCQKFCLHFRNNYVFEQLCITLFYGELLVILYEILTKRVFYLLFQ